MTLILLFLNLMDEFKTLRIILVYNLVLLISLVIFLINNVDRILLIVNQFGQINLIILYLKSFLYPRLK
jgi:hypothetical protein